MDSPLHRHSYLWVTEWLISYSKHTSASKVWGSCSSSVEDLDLLGCDVVSLCPSILAEHRSILLDPSSHKYKDTTSLQNLTNSNSATQHHTPEDLNLQDFSNLYQPCHQSTHEFSLHISLSIWCAEWNLKNLTAVNIRIHSHKVM